jgi:hypothetical protein
MDLNDSFVLLKHHTLFYFPINVPYFFGSDSYITKFLHLKSSYYCIACCVGFNWRSFKTEQTYICCAFFSHSHSHIGVVHHCYILSGYSHWACYAMKLSFKSWLMALKYEFLGKLQNRSLTSLYSPLPTNSLQSIIVQSCTRRLNNRFSKMSWRQCIPHTLCDAVEAYY